MVRILDPPGPQDKNPKVSPAAQGESGGMRVASVHNDLRLVANKGNIVGEVWGRTKGISGDALAGWRNNASFEPEYLDCVKPRDDEPNFPKWIWSGFHDTFLDQYLRSCGIRTLFAVGYSRRACLHYTCAEAVGRNYRVILLRDCSNASIDCGCRGRSLPMSCERLKRRRQM